MPVPLAHLQGAVDLGHAGARPQLARVGSEPHGAAHLLNSLLRRHERDHRVLALGCELARVRVGEPHDVAGELDDRALEPEADPEERELVLPRPADRLEHPLYPAHAEPAGHEQSLVGRQQLTGGLLIGEPVGGDPVDLHAAVVRDAAVHQGLVDALVAVRELGVLADHGDPHPLGRMEDLLHHLRPRAEIGLLRLEVQAPAHLLVEPLLVQLDRDLVDRHDVRALDHAAEVHVAELGDLALQVLGQRALRAADQDIRLDSDLHQLAHGVLGGFGLELGGRRDEGDEGQMDE